MNGIIVSPSSAAEIFAMTQMQEAAVESNGKAYLPFGAEIIKTSAASDDLIIGLDRNFALELIKSSDLVMDTDKIINRQLDSIAVSVNCGFRKLTAEAVHTLKITG